jgi:hypothetical protein
MARDMTAWLRHAALQADHRAAGKEYVLVAPIPDADAVDFTRAEVERLRNDPDEQDRQRRIQAEYESKLNEHGIQPRN